MGDIPRRLFSGSKIRLKKGGQARLNFFWIVPPGPSNRNSPLSMKKTEKMHSGSIQALTSLENLVGQVIRTVEEHGSDMYRQSDNFTNAHWETKWDFPGSLLFSMTTLSFIGKNMVST